MNDPAGMKSAILSLLPPELAAELKDSVDAVIQGQFQKMQLVSRQEFEIQQKVLAKTRAKLEALEQLVADLEQQQKE